MNAPPPKHDPERERREALAALESVRSPPTFAQSSLAEAARRAGGHFAGQDADPGDRIEVWGRRIGRVLSLVGVIALAIYLYWTYLR